MPVSLFFPLAESQIIGNMYESDSCICIHATLH